MSLKPSVFKAHFRQPTYIPIDQLGEERIDGAEAPGLPASNGPAGEVMRRSALAAPGGEQIHRVGARRPQDGPEQAAAALLRPGQELLVGWQGAAVGGAGLGGRLGDVGELKRCDEARVGGLQAGLDHLKRTGDNGARSSTHPDNNKIINLKLKNLHFFSDF